MRGRSRSRTGPLCGARPRASPCGGRRWREDARGAGGVPGEERVPVRLLRAGDDLGGGGAAGEESGAVEEGGAGGAGGESVPVHGVRADRGGGDGGRKASASVESRRSKVEGRGAEGMSRGQSIAVEGSRGAVEPRLP